MSRLNNWFSVSEFLPLSSPPIYSNDIFVFVLLRFICFRAHQLWHLILCILLYYFPSPPTSCFVDFVCVSLPNFTLSRRWHFCKEKYFSPLLIAPATAQILAIINSTLFIRGRFIKENKIQTAKHIPVIRVNIYTIIRSSKLSLHQIPNVLLLPPAFSKPFY